MQRHRLISVILSGFALLGICWAGTERQEEVRRIQSAATVMDEIMAAPDKGIPGNVLSCAECVAVVPSMVKGGFIVGADYGRGVVTCRTTTGWSAPAPFLVMGGSFRFQIGGEAPDLVMLVMNEQGMRQLVSGEFKIGADASVAAGPVGRHAEGNTDWKMRAAILTYARAHGVLAGLSLDRAVVKEDKKETLALYGRPTSFSAILKGQIEAPGDSQPFPAAVMKYAARAERDRASGNESGETTQSAGRDRMAQARMLTETEAKDRLDARRSRSR